jgi:mRNA-degrading endonuclease RelE of RelBE toxin-antitoxin system
MNDFIFTKKWLKEYDKLSISNQQRIVNKLKILKNYDDLNLILKNLEWFYPATHRLRVWNLRIILKKINNNLFYILDVWNRWDIYK